MIFADATEHDVPELVRLINAAYRTGGVTPGWTDERLLLEGGRTDDATLTDELRSGRMVLMREAPQGPIAACARIAPEGDAWSLSSIAVDPARQAGGLGAALLAEVERQAAAAGAQRLRMTVIQLRETLLAWYGRRGYRPTGDRMPFPYGDPRVGRPLRDDLELLVLEKNVPLSAAATEQVG